VELTGQRSNGVSRLDVPLQAILTDSDEAADVAIELTILLPCLNEAETIAICVQKAVSFLLLHNVDGEVLVADNGSTDGSPALAEAAGARVVPVPERGYGSALMAGIMAARGRFVIMGDADDSYDLTALMPFLKQLRAGADLVMGNRFRGGIAPGAMPPLHRYLGNPMLSFIGRLFFRSKIRDFHCGLRGFNRSRIIQVGLQATGMEFASEMVVKATLAGYRVEEVPTTLSPDGRSRRPHLRSWRDGWRHLRFLLLFSPRWLFFYPGLAMMLIGAAGGVTILTGPILFGGVKLYLATLAVACALVVIGFQALLFAIFTAVYGTNEGFLPPSNTVARFLRSWTLERGLVAAAVLGLTGLGGGIAALLIWADSNSHTNILHLVLPSLTALMISCQLLFSAFFISILGVRHSGHKDGGNVECVTVGHSGTTKQSAVPSTNGIAVSTSPARLTRSR
jgi:glycosyltransferase involved in cell wall biosynthesis